MTALPSGQQAMSAHACARRPSWLCRWLAHAAIALVVSAGALLFDGIARAEDPVKGEVRVYTDGGYVRLMFRLDQEVAATVRLTGPVMVINFKKPVDVVVDRINSSVPDIISAARRDPDGSAIRVALARKVKINTQTAGERLYVDLLPETWSGTMPGLPQEVVDDLARRALEAERQLRRQNKVAREWKPPNVRVRVASQPTFTRYVFEMPDGVNVVPERGTGKFTLSFDQQIKWDMADAKSALPPTLESVEAETDFDSASVIFTLNGEPTVRSFREDRSIVVDVGAAGARPRQTVEQAAAKLAGKPEIGPAIDAPETIPAKDVAAPEQPAMQSPPAAPPAAAATPAPAPAAAKPAPSDKAADITPSSPAPAAAPKPAVAAKPAAAPVAQKETPKPAAARAPTADGTVVAELRQSGDTLRLSFPFPAPTPAAMFRRADVLWLVFDSTAAIDLAAISTTSDSGIRSATLERGADGEAIVRIRLERPRLVSVDADAANWMISIGDSVTVPTRALAIARNIAGRGRASIAIPFENPRKVHRLSDPDIGDRLMVISALGPARGFLKAQSFVELQALPSAHGVVVHPIADDLKAELSPDKITIDRPGGLSISSTSLGQQQIALGFRAMTFDTQLWGYDRETPFGARQAELIRLAAAAPAGKRRQARINLARFYLARGHGAEAKAVLDIAMAEQRGSDDVTGSVLKAVADLMLDRPEDALKELSNPQVGNQQDAPLWRAMALARQGKWPEAREGFKGVDGVMAALPVELQRMAMFDALRASIEVRDFTDAARLINEFETIGVPPEQEPALAVLSGRLYEGLGRGEDALAQYRSAAKSRDRRAAAQARLREASMLFASGEMQPNNMVHELETITTIWRGDEIESEGLQRLANLYTKDGRYRDAFHVMRTALRTHPNSEMTRKIQDEAALTFDSLFMAGKGDALSPVEALGLFYDYRELTPIGRRGDEMIRKLADRLVAVDLLDQATELLQHQVDHRLQGAGRAQVATRLATIYLLNRKPDRALAVLQSTRSAELANELRDQRLLLEARTLSEIGRHDVALELIANIKGREATRLRSDILWSAKRWREAAEQIELLHGERWRDFAPLDEVERSDLLRAAIGYALGGEPMSLARLRERYAVKMADGPDRRAFDVVSAPIGTTSTEFQDVARRVANTDTLEAFLRDMRARFPDQVVPPSAADAAKTPPPVAAPARRPVSQNETPDKAAVSAAKPDGSTAAVPPKAPVGEPLRPDPLPTGSIRPRTQPRPNPVSR